MRALRAFLLRLTGMFGTFGVTRRDREIDEELRTHLEMMVDDGRRSGLREADARRQAAAAFGSVASAAETYRDRRGLPAFESLMRDGSYAARSLLRTPGATVAMVLVLGLGVGISTALATIFHAVVWRPLPVPEPDRVVKLSLRLEGDFSRGVRGHPSWFSYPEATTVAGATRALAGVAAARHERVRWRRDGGEPLGVDSALVTASYFDVLQLRAARGRLFMPADERQPVAVIAHRLWTDAFASDPQVVGRTMVLDRLTYTIVGVLEPGFRGTEVEATDLWLPLEAASLARGNAKLLADANVSWLQPIARLAPGQTMEAVRAEAAVIAARLDAPFPTRRATILLTQATRLDPGLASEHRDRPKLAMVGGALTVLVGLVLLICTSNVAGLLLARGASRQKETAIRLALGAGRFRIVQQLAAESLWIAGASAALGFVLCAWSLRVAAHALPLGGVLDDFRPDATVLIFAMLSALAAALLFGIAPALQTLDVDPLPALKQDGSRTGRRMPAARLRHVLVSAQIALSLVLLVICALLARGVQGALRLDAGFDPTGLQIVSVDVPPGETTTAPRPPLMRTLRDTLAATPGVREVGLASDAPFRGRGQMPLRTPQMSSPVQVTINAVDAAYFRALGVSLVAGRMFERDEAGTAVVVNAALARQFFGNERTAIGGTVEILGSGNRWQPRTVVGVVPTLQTTQVGKPDEPTFYSLLRDDRIEEAVLVVRTVPGTPLQRVAVDTVRPLDPEATPAVDAVEARIERATTPARVGVAVAGAIGGLALLIAAIGLYGIVAYAVTCRTPEIGVHMALGASRGRVLRLIMGSSLRAIAGGAIVGALLVIVPALAFTRVLAPMLLGVSPLDPIALLTAVAVLLIVAMGAAWLPARRALGLGPIVALRADA